MSYRPPSHPPITAWARHLDAVMQARKWSRVRLFEEVGAMLYSARNGNGSHPGLITILPSVGLDFLLRFGLALVACLVAAWKGWPALAYAAACLAAPTLWITRLVPLLAMFRLRREARG